MKRHGVSRLGAATAGLVAVSLVSVAVSAASGSVRGGGGCAQRAMIKSVFPTANEIGFSRRGRTTAQGARAPVWPGRCVGWWVEYQRLGAAGRVESYADVVVTLYDTHAQALVALSEPLGIPTVTLANGARARVASTHGWVGSVIGNVHISSTSSSLPAKNGIPDFKGGPDLSPAALLRIHRAIHANVLRLR